LVAEIHGSRSLLARDRQIVLRRFELVEEAALHDIDFVEVQGGPEPRGPVADVTDFEHGVGCERTLQPDIPRHDIAALQVRIEVIDAVACVDGQGIGWSGCEGHRGERGVAEQHAARRYEELRVHSRTDAGGDGAALVGSPDSGDAGEIAAGWCDRETRAQDRLSIFAQEPADRAIMLRHYPCGANGRRPESRGRVALNVAAGHYAVSGDGSAAGAGLEEIADAGNA